MTDSSPDYKTATQIRNHAKGLVLFVLGIVIGVFLLKPLMQSDDKPSPQVAETQPSVMAVRAVRPQTVSVQDTLSANGLIAAAKTAEVGGQLSGVAIEQVLVEVGDWVRQGQVLAVLDTRTLSEQVAAGEAELAAAVAAQKKAQADLARTEPLLAIDAVSRQEVDAYRAAVSQSDANVRATNARLATARTNQARSQVVAPVAGIISAKNAQIGMLATGASLFSIIEKGQLQWRAALSPIEANRVRIGQLARLEIADRTITGKVVRISPVANDSREVAVWVDLPKDSGASAGMYQAGELIFAEKTLPAVPKSALMSSDGYDYLWLLEPTQTAGQYRTKRHNISIISYQEDKIIADVPQDALVVAEGVSFLGENDLVTLVSIDNQPTSEGK